VLFSYCFCETNKGLIKTFSDGLIQVVRAKTAYSQMALRGHNSGAVSTNELFKCLKDAASLVVCRKMFWFWGSDFL